MFVQVGNFLIDTMLKYFNSIATDWGIIGIGMISIFVLQRVINFIKRFFK